MTKDLEGRKYMMIVIGSPLRDISSHQKLLKYLHH
jgi:hypothetical protein